MNITILSFRPRRGLDDDDDNDNPDAIGDDGATPKRTTHFESSSLGPLRAGPFARYVVFSFPCCLPFRPLCAVYHSK